MRVNFHVKVKYIKSSNCTLGALKRHYLTYLLYIGTDYKNGDIRLVGGSYSWQGRVEIYLNGEWGTITHDNTDKMDAHVVCRQLGYDTRCELVVCNN